MLLVDVPDHIVSCLLISIERHAEETFMQSATQTASGSKQRLWAGRIICALVTLFLLLDSGLKLMMLAPAVAAEARLGYPASLVLLIEITELICLVHFVL
jgi:hypothetical protein